MGGADRPGGGANGGRRTSFTSHAARSPAPARGRGLVRPRLRDWKIQPDNSTSTPARLRTKTGRAGFNQTSRGRSAGLCEKWRRTKCAPSVSRAAARPRPRGSFGPRRRGCPRPRAGAARPPPAPSARHTPPRNPRARLGWRPARARRWRGGGARAGPAGGLPGSGGAGLRRWGPRTGPAPGGGGPGPVGKKEKTQGGGPGAQTVGRGGALNPNDWRARPASGLWGRHSLRQTLQTRRSGPGTPLSADPCAPARAPGAAPPRFRLRSPSRVPARATAPGAQWAGGGWTPRARRRGWRGRRKAAARPARSGD